jgi:hypothetical protein
MGLIAAQFQDMRFCCALMAMLAVPLAPGLAQLPAVQAPTPQAPGLEQLLAPVALYPDRVLTDILAASTYPTQVVEAERFLGDPAHVGVQGEALMQAVAGEDWDASVKDLMFFPQVLQMMDGHLDWTEHLGRAVAGDQAAVMAAIQELRQRAEMAGTLTSGPQVSVVNEGGDISIEPASGQQVFLPGYDSHCVYGAAAECGGGDDALDWGSGFFVPYGFGDWGFIDWGARNIRFRHGGEGDVWRPARIGHFETQAGTGNGRGFSYAAPANAPFRQRLVSAGRPPVGQFRAQGGVRVAAPARVVGGGAGHAVGIAHVGVAVGRR